jgi:hypothetical protein
MNPYFTEALARDRRAEMVQHAGDHRRLKAAAAATEPAAPHWTCPSPREIRAWLAALLAQRRTAWRL